MALTDRQPRLVVAAILPVLLSTIVVFIRATRKVKRRPNFISMVGAITAEVLIVSSVVAGWLSGAFVLVSIYHGFGRHTDSILASPDGQNKLVNAAFWQQMGYRMNVFLLGPVDIAADFKPAFNLACYCISVAGQVMHYRTWLFSSVSGYKVLSGTMYASGILQVILGAVCIISVFAKCSPVEANWNPFIAAEAECWAESVFLGLNYASGAVTFCSYMIQAWIPIHLALRLQKPKMLRDRWIGLAVLATWNIAAGMLALLKIAYLHLYVVEVDPTFRRAPLIEVGLAENGASGIVPSAAEMWYLAQQVRSARTNATGSDGYRTRSQTFDRSRAHEPPVSRGSSDVELTGGDNKADFAESGKIVKTTAWETARSDAVGPGGWYTLSDSDGSELRPDAPSGKSIVSHGT